MKLEEAIVYLLVTQLAHDPVIGDRHLLIEEAFGGVGDFGVATISASGNARATLTIRKIPALV